MQWPQNKPRDPVQLGIKIQIDTVAMQKLWAWTDLARGEVSCLGLIEEIRDESTGLITALRVTDFFLVKQVCSADETTMDQAAIAELIMSLEVKGIDSRKLRCWAHSHGTMTVFWSGTDHDCIDGLANGDYLVSLVVNKKRDAMCRLDVYHPAHLFVTDIVWEVYTPLPESLEKACFEEFQTKVSESQWTRGNGKLSNTKIVQDLHSARDRGALTLDELDDELDWLGLERGDLDEQPF